ncbi:ATP-dependent DNA helicase [Sphingobacterium thalpophilum]|uniref:Conjugal transfer nickase/helicase TraI n=1 Tax=Sphingobacterium thalpophilum TaxID=259 RepID=A0A4U9W1T8_9SPHI|nr:MULTISPECIES: AAA family ATPase [Sphingobacterium]MCW8311933.1 AAA family ATPase [Sphingobacterium sp. InxBP1]VTR52024.1 conjugal transfer nickase/helicase TraI [Sphingobacterium thalpophilum]
MFIKNLFIQQFPWQPTAQQLDAFELLEEFLLSFDRQSCFVLRGYAGTGKTTLIAALVKVLPALKKRAVLLAPTGRAAKVMSYYSGRKALTIHKKIYRKKSAVSFQMDFMLGENLHEDTLFIIDEASMISNEPANVFSKSLLHDLIRYVQSGKNCTLLFVGDTAQLPPVGLSDSPALSPSYLENEFQLCVYPLELTTVVRQSKDSGILYNATKIREQITSSTQEQYEFPFPKFITKGFKDLYRMTGERLIEGINYAYDKYGIENTMIICRSNRSANLYNQNIRNRILFRDEELTGGDYIMVVKNNYYWLQENNMGEGFIANGDMAKVRKVSNIHDQHGYRFADVTLEFIDLDEIEPITCRVILDSLYADGPSLSYDDQKNLYEEIALDYADIPDKKDRLEAIKKDPYYNALQIKFAFAVTCHKAQGGQWPIVFVDQGYVNDEMLDLEFLRWLYTAVTRATQELFLVNFSENFYPS